jgi:hypothetical protein
MIDDGRGNHWLAGTRTSLRELKSLSRRKIIGLALVNQAHGAGFCIRLQYAEEGGLSSGELHELSVLIGLARSQEDGRHADKHVGCQRSLKDRRLHLEHARILAEVKLRDTNLQRRLLRSGSAHGRTLRHLNKDRQ